MGQPAAEKACGICDRFGRCGRGLRWPGRDTMRSVRRLRLSLAAHPIRHSPHNALRLGNSIDPDYRTVLAGHTWVGGEHGTLGVSARGKAPIFDGQNRVIGIVSVGFLEGTLSEQLAAMLPQLAFYVLVALGLGVAGSALLARRLKRQTFGLEPGEIAGLLEPREA